MSFLDDLFPSVRTITHHIDKPGSNSIIITSSAIYGKMRSGKTELVEHFVEKAIEKYGIENVNARCVSRGAYFPFLINYGLDKKLVNILFCDNASLSRIRDRYIEQYFTIAHKWKKLTGRPYGYILCFFASHRLHGLKPVELRTNLDSIIFRSGPSNRYDKNVVKDIVGDNNYNKLCHFDIDRRRNVRSPTWNKSIYWMQGELVGEYNSSLTKKNYLKEVQVPVNAETRRLWRECNK